MSNYSQCALWISGLFGALLEGQTAMTGMKLQLLGPVTVTDERGELVKLDYDKVRALLAYLVVEDDRAHLRTRLAGLLWPERPEAAARHSLSQALFSLRRSVGEDCFVISRQSIQFIRSRDCQVDLLDFRTLVAGSNSPGDADRKTPSRFRLEQAVNLYRGPFLEGFSLEDAPEFEDWMRSVQESTERQLTNALTTLIDQLELDGDLDHACAYARRLIDLDPWEDAYHRLAMRLLAASGHRRDAIKQYEACVQTLKRDLDIDPDPETVELAERIKAGLEGPSVIEPRTHAPVPPRRPVLPAPPSSTVGRDAEIEEVARTLRLGESRLVTLVGPGGIGKSRLALEVARALEPDMPDGAYFVGLAGTQDPDHVASSILTVTSAQADPDADPVEQLCSFLQQRRMLLLLDNFEHLLDGATLLAELLERAPDLLILVTSRERLSLTSESVYDVEGLSLPERDDSPSIATSGATRLFMLRARKHKASLLPRPEESPAIARIARLTGGMPLALELAAAWVPVLSISEIADEIETSLDFLASSMRDLPARHQSVRAVLGRSWENLSEVEQRAFRRLSVFQGGFTRAAASYVTGASLPVLSALVSKSMLRHTSEGRYEVHELLRQFGAGQLAQDPEEDAVVKDRCRDFYIGFLAVREEQLEGGAQALVLPEIAVEIDNIRAAWQRAVLTSDYAGLSRVAHSLWLYNEIIGRYREGDATMRQAYTALGEVTDESERQRPDFQMALARVRSRWASFGFRMHGPAVLLDEVQLALETVRRLDDPGELGMLLNYQAVAAHALGDLETEEQLLIESIEQFERAGHRWGIAYSTNDLGHVRALQGDLEGARVLHQQALAILEELGDSRGIAFAMRNLGIVARQMGEGELALQLLRRSVDVRRPIGNQWGIADSLNQIGVLLRDSGDVVAASEHFREALQIAREIRAMQLASEILREYLPLLPAPILDTARDRLYLPEEIQSIVTNDDDPYELSTLVDSVLGDETVESFDHTWTSG